MGLIKTLYPRAGNKKVPTNDPAIKKARRAFIKASGSNFLFLQLLFLGLFCYIFGSLFQQQEHTHNLRIAFVDYDGGAIGRAVRQAYASLQSDGFPSLVELSPSDLETPTDVREAVCEARFWAALYVNEGASAALHDALVGSDAASAYDGSNALTYVWNEALYAPVVDGAISFNLQRLSDAARVAYTRGNGTGNLTSVSGPAAMSVLANPWQLRSIDIQPTPQGSRAIYNSITIILILIQEFFYLGTINGLYAQFKLYHRLNPIRIIAVRALNSVTYTFVGSLCVTGAIWAFRAGWNVDGGQFAMTWMALWLFAHINFLTLDVFTVWLPPPFIPMALISWILMNVTSVLLPFDLSAGFYRLGYVFPAHEVYQVLTDIWSGGCNPKLHYALPILFVWEVVSFSVSALGVFRRSHYATLAEERQAAEFKELLDAAVEFEVERRREEAHPIAPQPDQSQEKEDGEGKGEGEDEEEIREGLADVLERVETRQQRENERAPVGPTFGPAFHLPFSHETGSD